MRVAPEQLTALGPDVFVSASETTEAGHARDFAETWSWVEPLLKRVPITRVYDATPIDFIGSPVWSAVTPLAKDLTVHAGKGATAHAAKLSAVMEAIERVSAERLTPDRVFIASHQDLTSSGAVNPEDFNLPYNTRYRPDAVFSWTGAYDLIGQRHCLVPTDLVLSPASEGITTGPETNGLASGNTYTEATLHALYEVVERDALSEESFYSTHHDPGFSPPRPLRIIDPTSLPPGTALELAKKLADSGLTVRIDDLRNSVDVPVFRATLLDKNFLGYEGQLMSFAGYGADLDPLRALLRALTEAAQAHTGVAIGARDEFEGMRPTPARPAMLRRSAWLHHETAPLPFPPDKGGTGDLLQNLHEVLRRLRAAGHQQCLVTEVTRRDLDVPVVRVLVPGLAAPYGDSSRTPTIRLLATVI